MRAPRGWLGWVVLNIYESDKPYTSSTFTLAVLQYLHIGVTWGLSSEMVPVLIQRNQLINFQPDTHWNAQREFHQINDVNGGDIFRESASCAGDWGAVGGNKV